MKRVLSIVLQFILYLLAFAIGSFLPVFQLLPSLSFSIGAGRVFIYDGVLLMLVLYLLILLIAAARKKISLRQLRDCCATAHRLILLIAAARKKIPAALRNATLAFLLAMIVGLLLKFGFKSI